MAAYVKAAPDLHHYSRRNSGDLAGFDFYPFEEALVPEALAVGIRA